MSTYLIFNQLRFIHPQFRPKSRTSVLEPSQNFLNIPPITQSCRGRKTSIESSCSNAYLVLTIVIKYSIVVVRARSKEEAICQRGPHILWLKRATIRLLSYFRRCNRTL
ncbi:neurotrimin-like isoform X2 [Vespula squamosa]|uniref:Neurotrimin-like isoform X2 n=1 Tax=Vespula squamosa TaxID=30214 RepID=A0ABD2APB0_VESSQ